jgi:teichuronic acid biosynthesis glycosyltransferase TuaH
LIPEQSTARLALAVADINWFSTENLFRAVDRQGTETLLLSCMDYRNAWQKGARPWRQGWGEPLRALDDHHWRADLVLPSGWMKRFPHLGMRPIARVVRRWRRRNAPDAPLALVMTYPYYAVLRDQLRPDRTVYYNLDDYSLYWPAHADEVRALERQVVRESNLTICVSRLRAEELRSSVPEASARIHHLPHGTPAAFLSATPWHQPADPPGDIAGLTRPLLGYIGSMEDREDWPLLIRLADAMPGASIILIGRPSSENVAGPSWVDEYRECVRRPNVHALGWRPQAELPQYLRAFDVNLIPYRVDHPFNRACSPTKLMDGMGSGRPIVSTDLPECRLYADLIDVARDADAFIAQVRALIAASSDDGRAAARHDHARRHTCAAVASRLLDLISS